MRNFTAYFLLSIALFLSSCDVNSNGPSTSTSNPEVTADPVEGGTVKASGNKLIADPERGFIFRYWQVNHPDGTITALSDDSVTIQNKPIESAKGVFGPNKIARGGPFTIRAGANQRYAYYVTNFIMPVDTASRKNVDIIVQADLENQTKKKIFITEKNIRRFDVSSDKRYIAFSSYNTGDVSSFEVDTYIYDLATREITTTRTGGVEPLWANNSNKLLIGSQTGACIYDMISDGCRKLAFRNSNSFRPRGFDAAAWSPNDANILLSRDTEDFYLFDTQTFDRQVVETENRKGYFIWLDNESFVTNGNFIDKNNENGTQYSLQNLTSPQSLAYKAGFIPISSSPSRGRFAIINMGDNNGVNIYDRSTDTSKNILNFIDYDPILLTWVNENNILFYGRNQKRVLRLTPRGKVIKL